MNPNAGSAYVFRFDGESWESEAWLVDAEPATEDEFGKAVGVGDDVIVIGVPYHDGVGADSGAAYVFRDTGSGWTEESILVPSDPAAYDGFGFSVAVEGEVIIVGSFCDDDLGVDSGSVYVFRWDGQAWNEETKLLASDGAADDSFGLSLALDEGGLLIGAWGDDDQGEKAGSAYVFRFDGDSWTEEAKLTASDGAASDFFGGSVGLSGDVAIVGAHEDDDFGSGSGAAYVYRRVRSTWQEEAKLLAWDGAEQDAFGYRVAVNGATVCVGAYESDLLDLNAGSAYLFRYDGSQWLPEAQLLASDHEAADRLGRAVALSSDFALAGAPDEDETAYGAGAVYSFPAALSGEDCNANYIADLCDIELGFSEDINANGVPDECECVGDVNGDGTVDVLDLAAVLGTWGQSGVPADVYYDGIVDVLDLLLVLADWGCLDRR